MLYVHFKIRSDYRFTKYIKVMEGKCKNCGRDLAGMPPDAKYCSIECTYGLPSFTEVAVYP